LRLEEIRLEKASEITLPKISKSIRRIMKITIKDLLSAKTKRSFILRILLYQKILQRYLIQK